MTESYQGLTQLGQRTVDVQDPAVDVGDRRQEVDVLEHVAQPPLRLAERALGALRLGDVERDAHPGQRPRAVVQGHHL